MSLPERLKFGIFMAPFHWQHENPTASLQRDLELIQMLDRLGYDEAWIGEHHSGGWEIIASPEMFIGIAAERTKNIKLGTGVISLPYHHPLMVANRMVLLDHLTRGRVMMGVGPGALVGDAYMLGITPATQRRRMEESLGIILRLWTEEEPITYEAEWFTLKEARSHLRPYTKPHPLIAVAASASPSGMVTGGKFGATILSLNTVRFPGLIPDHKKFWTIAEETAAKYGQKVNRHDWGLVLHAFIGESRKEAIEQARVKAGYYQRDYFEKTLGVANDFKGPREKVIDYMVENGSWCVGTPDDLVAHIKRLDEESGGFGRLLVQATEWGTREQVDRSYELIARYVMPHFQGSSKSLIESQRWSEEKEPFLNSLRAVAMDVAKADYLKQKGKAASEAKASKTPAKGRSKSKK
ncbi:MAG: LLM class flavin-dependent oxidoreductase [SAR202 cluster bacterium]|nr:LLM class flavin-dependent oxidoreductase [SAR202 cluster bacterium]